MPKKEQKKTVFKINAKFRKDRESSHKIVNNDSVKSAFPIVDHFLDVTFLQHIQLKQLRKTLFKNSKYKNECSNYKN